MVYFLIPQKVGPKTILTKSLKYKSLQNRVDLRKAGA